MMEKEFEIAFAGVFLIKKRLFVSIEEKVGGPRLMVFPPKEIDVDISASLLGTEIIKALAGFSDKGRRILAPQWEELNKQLLEFFEEPSVSSFERKKKEVTIRLDIPSGVVTLIGPKHREIILQKPDPNALGQAVKDLIGIK